MNETENINEDEISLATLIMTKHQILKEPQIS